MRTYFGTVTKDVKLIDRKVLNNGFISTTFTFGNLSVQGISNRPTNEALMRFANGINKIAENHISY